MEHVDINSTELLIFLHIPKTAGSTMHHILARQYPAETVYSIDGDHVQETYDLLRGLPEAVKQQLTCIKGHLPYGVHEFFQQQAKYITYLRDPANWVRSYYTFILSIPAHPLHQEVSACHGLEEFCALLTQWGMDDYQTRILAGTDDHTNIMPPYGPMPDNALELAIAHIEKNIPVVGLVERFDESLLVMKHLFNWRSIRYLKQNITQRPNGHVLTEQQKALIYRNNPMDLALYQYARDRLETQIKQLGADFSRQLKQLQQVNRLFSKAYPYYMLLKLNRLKSVCCQLANLVTGGR